MGWSGGLAERQEGGKLWISVVFTWRIHEAEARALWARAEGLEPIVGGPALFTAPMRRRFAGLAEVGTELPDAVALHHPQATVASRGCPVGCWFCIVPKMEGRGFTLLPDFPVRPILCDNNLSALPEAYQRHIIGRYEAAGVPLRDANSGFEPRSFDETTYARWRPLLNAGGGPWRFAYDEMAEGPEVRRMMRILRAEPASRKRVYTLIGNEPLAACLERIEEVVARGGQPYAQPLMSLTALRREPIVRHDWTRQLLIDVSRWTNRRAWRYQRFAEYRRWRPPPDPQQEILL